MTRLLTTNSINALLKLLVIYKSRTSQTAQNRTIYSSIDNAAFVSTLCLLICQPRLSLFLDTLKYLFDVAALCFDDLVASTSSSMATFTGGANMGSQVSVNADASEQQRS